MLKNTENLHNEDDLWIQENLPKCISIEEKRKKYVRRKVKEYPTVEKYLANGAKLIPITEFVSVLIVPITEPIDYTPAHRLLQFITKNIEDGTDERQKK